MSDAVSALAVGAFPALPPLPAGLLDDLQDPAVSLLGAIQGGMTPDPALTVSEWADAHRILSGKSASEPGPYRTARTPYLKEIMDALSPNSPVQRIAFMKSAQIGATEAGNNWIGYVIANAPGPMIAVSPTVELAKRFSKQRVDNLIETTAVLRQKVAPARTRDSGNTILTKEYVGGMLVLTGANSAVGLRSMPARYALLDECDAYPADADGEGSPIALAEARTKTFSFRKKVFLISTPTITGRSQIEAEYLASDQRRYFVPCPHCGHPQHLRFESLRWTKGQPETAEYHCEDCGAAMHENDKTEMFASGQWRATVVCDNPLVRGYHLNSLYSPIGWQSWADIAREFESANKAGPEAMRAFKNTVLGESYAERGEAPDWERLLERRESFTMGEVPKGALVLTAGIDNQSAPARIEFALWAWAPGTESWLVDVHVIPGSPGDNAPWDEIAKLMNTAWPCADGGLMKISAACADTGGNWTQSCYSQIRRLRDPRIKAIKGVPGWNRAAPVNGPTLIDITENGRKIRRGLKLFTVAVDGLKQAFYSDLERTRSEDGTYPPGYVHLPEGADAEIIKQLVSEQLVTVKDRRGFAKSEFQKLRPNEMLDCRTYSRAALNLLGADRYGDRFWTRYRRDNAADPDPLPPDLAPEVPPPPLSPFEVQPLDRIVAEPQEGRVTITQNGAPTARQSRARRYA